MTSISRNSPCPCGSGKRYKHCCGANPGSNTPVSNQGSVQVKDLLTQALKLQDEGREEEAGTLYEAVLEIDPKNPNAHNMMAVIRAEEWRMAEALNHAHQAGELTDWRDPFFYQNYTVLIRKALKNVEADRFKQSCKRYREDLSASPLQAGIQPLISALIFERMSATELEQCLQRLAEQSLQPHEVLIPADSAGAVSLQAWPFRVRVIEVSSGIEAERINYLAGKAHGGFIYTLRKDDRLLPEHLSRLTGGLNSIEGWAFASELPLEDQVASVQNYRPTAGFLLLSKDTCIATESNLLVSRDLHKCIGGYSPTSPEPLLDYCLRLLWEKEPGAIANESCVANPRAAQAIDDRLLVFGNYLERAVRDVVSPNPFAPSFGNWGVYLLKHVAEQALFVGTSFMAFLNNRIGSLLTQRMTSLVTIEAGVNLIGYVSGELGLGENMRAFARACLGASIPCAIRDVNIGLITREGDSSLDAQLSDQANHGCSIFFVNPDRPELYRHSLDAAVFERPYLDFKHTKIGYWFWELEKIPPQWRYAIDKVDEIWVATEFIANAMRRVTDKPVIKIPTPIAFDVRGNYGRGYFGLPAEKFLFLFSFDFESFPERKNPYALIRAFQKAFPLKHQNVGLVIKSVNGTRRPVALQRLNDQIGNDSRIILKNDFMNRDEVYGLQSVVDAYVSLHRAEGLGLGLAECMYQGKPVIGTAYSGNLEFMNEANSALVNYSLAPVQKGHYLYDDPGFFWAEADEDHAAYLMAKLVDDVPYRKRIASQGQVDIRNQFSHASMAERIKSRLAQIGAL